MGELAKFGSAYGILDVTRGRKALAKRIATSGPVPIVIHAVLTGPFGSDDCVSIEFNMDVSSVEEVGS